ncbi:hypothetical protein [Actinomadura sp. K4S16]|uniref:hypothetical protein n=1 Tax=Actinomadura sp. K4S16 TaxID=1316147 RepID=UPI0011EBD1D0|nr:hypothetical protein [Actinomadura sp. K4S16]
MEGEGLLQQRDGLSLVSEAGVPSADVGECVRMADPITCDLEQLAGLLSCGQSVGGALLQTVGEVAGVMGFGLAGKVAHGLGEVEGMAVVAVGDREPAQVRLGRSEMAVRAGLRRCVGQPSRGAQRGPVGRGAIVPAATPVEEDRERPGQLAGVAVQPGAVSMPDHRLMGHYLHSAHAADLLLYPHGEKPAINPPEPGITLAAPGDREQALTWFAAEREVLLAAPLQPTPQPPPLDARGDAR